MGETHSNVGQQLVTSCRKFKNIQRCTTVQFPKQFSHSSLCSFGVQGPSITGQDCGRDRLSPISCTQFKIRIAQHDSPVPKQFSHSSLCFLVDHVLASQIKTVEETLWVKPTPI